MRLLFLAAKARFLLSLRTIIASNLHRFTDSRIRICSDLCHNNIIELHYYGYFTKTQRCVNWWKCEDGKFFWIFFWKKLRKNLQNLKCLTYLCSVIWKRIAHVSVTFGVRTRCERKWTVTTKIMKAELIIPIESLRGALRKDGYYFRICKGQQIVQRCPRKWTDTPARKAARERFIAKYRKSKPASDAGTTEENT